MSDAIVSAPHLLAKARGGRTVYRVTLLRGDEINDHRIGG